MNLEPNPGHRLASQHCCSLCVVVFLLATCSDPARAQDPFTLPFPGFGITTTSHPAHLLLFGGHSVGILEIRSQQFKQKLHLEEQTIAAASWSAGGNLILGGTAKNETGWVACFASASSDERLWEVELDSRVTCICSTRQQLLVGDEAGAVIALDAESGTILWTRALHSKLVTSLAPLASRTCASADWSGKITIFDTETGEEQINFQQHRDQVTGLLVENQGTLTRLYSASRDGTVRLWYPEQGRLVRFVQLDQSISAMCMIADAKLAVASRDAKIHVVDMDSAKVESQIICDLEYIAGMGSMDGQLICVDGKATAQWIDVANLSR